MKKVLVIGDIIFDRYVSVTTERNCQEDKDVPILDYESEETRLGGAANVAANIAALGQNEVEVYISGILRGTDIHKLHDNNVFVAPGLCEYGDFIEKTRYHVGNKLIARIDNKKRFNSFYKETYNTRICSGKSKLSDYDLIVMSDYNKGTLDAHDRHFVLENSLCPIIVDSKRRDLSIFAGADFLNINEEEFSVQVSNKDYIIENLFDTIIVTKGSNGAELRISESGKKDNEYIVHTEKFPANKITAVDVTGCGDTHTAAFAVGLIRDSKDIRNAIRFATACATIAATKYGTARITKWDFLKSLDM